MVKDIGKLLVILGELGVIRGRTRFQKIIFLMKQEKQIDLGFNFIPYYYGPYSRDLQLAINLLEAADFVQVMAEGGNLYVHRLTAKGRKIARLAENKMHRSERKALSVALRSYRERSTYSLIREAKQLATFLA